MSPGQLGPQTIEPGKIGPRQLSPQTIGITNNWAPTIEPRKNLDNRYNKPYLTQPNLT